MTSKEHLNVIFSKLPTELQQDVINYAESLLQSKGYQVAEEEARFYICPQCFLASYYQQECHGHLMIPCNADQAEDCKPLVDKEGNIKSRAPKWFITSVMTIDLN